MLNLIKFTGGYKRVMLNLAVILLNPTIYAHLLDHLNLNTSSAKSPEVALDSQLVIYYCTEYTCCQEKSHKINIFLFLFLLVCLSVCLCSVCLLFI